MDFEESKKEKKSKLINNGLQAELTVKIPGFFFGSVILLFIKQF